MKVKELTLAQWQDYREAFYKEHSNTTHDAAFRIDGTQFSVGAYYGGFTYNGRQYTVFYFTDGMIGVRMDFLDWVTKKLKEQAKARKANFKAAQPSLFDGGDK